MEEDIGNKIGKGYRTLELLRKKGKKIMGKVIPLNNITYLDIPADMVLEQARGELEGVVLMGFDNNEKFYCASSYADGGDVLYLIELLKQKLMNIK